MKLNLGCNDFKLKGFINIDIDPRVNPDVVADVCKLPYEDNSVEEIYAGHVLEHIPMYIDALKEWHRVLQPGGKITITVPDIAKALELDEHDGLNLSLEDVVFGESIREQQRHWRVLTESKLYSLMSVYFIDLFVLKDSPYLLARVPWQTIITGKK